MLLTTAPPLLFALGVRIFLNYINPSHTDSTPDYLLHGLWQGVLLYHSLKHTSWLVFPVGFAITAKLLLDFAASFDTTKCACTLLGAALGVLFTDILAQLFEYGRYNEVEPSPAASPQSPSHGPSRRLRLVSFQRGARDERPSHRHRASADRGDRDRTRTAAASPAPTHARSIDSALTLDSLPSSIDPHGQLSPAERDVAVLRARASLADSERRRFKEERKWALSQGNVARADQLAWQVKRYTALMDSFHREADAKLLEAARASQPLPIPPPPAQPPRHSQIMYTQPQQQASTQQTTTQAGPSNGHPLVSVTLGGPSRSRKRSGGQSILKPSIHVHTR